jgi:hypothetical protein
MYNGKARVKVPARKPAHKRALTQLMHECQLQRTRPVKGYAFMRKPTKLHRTTGRELGIWS